MSAVASLTVDEEGLAQAPEWIELIPAGPDVRGIDGRAWKMRDPQAVIAATNAAGRPLALDWEHATMTRAPQGLEAPAAGWIEELQARNGAIWGRVMWTPGGRKHVTERAYRFVSPVFSYQPASNEITRLTSVGLTNTPNLQLTAMNKSQATAADLTAEEAHIAKLFRITPDSIISNR